MAPRYVPHGRDSPRPQPHQFRATCPIFRQDFLLAFDEMRAAYLKAIGGNEGEAPAAKKGDGYVTMPKRRKTRPSTTETP